MADIRIKDLTTTASSTASDDFFAADGTTNGTRKLSAYSPSFGGNATVGGTLTVSGGTVSVGNFSITPNGIYLGGGSPGAGRLVYSANSGTTICGQTATDYDTSLANPSGSVALGVPAGTLTIKIPSTSASTSTSSGALVVGNGTSGGLGVGGAIYAGGDVFVVKADPSSTLTRTANTNNALFQLTTGATYDFAFGLRNTTDSDFHLYNYGTSADAIKIARSSSVVSVLSTTASTGTSSGALVVSGGVGVAKEMYLGGGLLNVAKGGAGATIEINADSGFASKLAMQRAATNRWTLEVDSSDVLTLKSLGTTAALTMTGTTSAEFVGSIKTAAPSGGTAANWKLGTVASVSPTSPNRTIEVDIGGTIYYIHAKTTNN